jgi:transposase
MAQTIEIALHHTKEELTKLYKDAKNPTERTRLHFLSMLRNKNRNSSVLAISIKTAMKRVGMKLTWAQDTVRKYNEQGLAGTADARKNNRRPAIVREEEKRKLKEGLLSGSSPDGGLWTGPKAAKYLGELVGKELSAVTGWRQLVSLGFSLKAPRLAHEKRATPEEQEAFKKNSASFTGKRSSHIPERT